MLFHENFSDPGRGDNENFASFPTVKCQLGKLSS